MKKVSDIFKATTDKQLKQDLSNSSSLFVFNYRGVNSVDLTKLRRDLIRVGARVFVTKNSFIKLAFKSSSKEDILNLIDGSIALVFIKDDPVGPSKVLTDFIKTHETVDLKGGYIQNRIIAKQDFKILSNIPPKQVLYQQIAIGLNGPASKLAIDLNQIIAKLAYALKAISDKKGESKK